MEKETVVKILEKIKKKKILIVGDVMLDEYLWGKVDRISPEAPVPVVKVQRQSYSLGGASNVAYNIYSLGAEPILLGVVGRDAAGRSLKSLIKRGGMDDRGILTEEGRPTIVKKRVIAHHQQVVRVDIEETFPINKETEESIISFIENNENEFCAVILEDYNKGLLTEDMIKKIISLAVKENKFIAVDPKFEHFYDYKEVSLFKPNIRELERVSGRALNEEFKIIETLKDLRNKIKARAVLITMGEEGMILLEEDKEPYRVKHHISDVYDVTGAGDTVISSITLAAAVGLDLKEATEFAGISAAIEVTKLGATPVKPSEIIDFCDK
jgi:rfaE bifunctional protein kinase chain/domain